MSNKKISISYILVIFIFAYISGIYSGHIVVIKSDGTVCAEMK